MWVVVLLHFLSSYHFTQFHNPNFRVPAQFSHGFIWNWWENPSPSAGLSSLSRFFYCHNWGDYARCSNTPKNPTFLFIYKYIVTHPKNITVTSHYLRVIKLMFRIFPSIFLLAHIPLSHAYPMIFLQPLGWLVLVRHLNESQHFRLGVEQASDDVRRSWGYHGENDGIRGISGG